MTLSKHESTSKLWGRAQLTDDHRSPGAQPEVNPARQIVLSALCTVRLAWPSPWQAADYCERQISESELAAGRYNPEEDFPGLPGVYVRLSEELARAIAPDRPLSAFLHESYQASIETWTLSVADPANESAGIEETRKSLTELVEYRKRTIRGSFSMSQVVTTTEQLPSILKISGRCIIAQPL